MVRRAGWIVGALGLGVALGGCTDATGPGIGHGAAVRAQLYRLPGGTPASGLRAAPRVEAASPSGPPWSSNLSITSFQVPIRSVWLVDSTGGGPEIYRCAAGSNDGCLVDLAGPALQDLLGAAPTTVSQGTYTAIAVATCMDETTYQALLTATVPVGGVTYGTSAASALDTAAAEPVRLTYHGCVRRYQLAAPLVIGDSAGAPVSVKLYFDIRDVAWASPGSADPYGPASVQAAWLPSGCSGPNPGLSTVAAPFVCAGYPDVAATVDTLVPVVERYRINGGATIGLIFQASSGAFIGGYTRRWFVEGAPSDPGFIADVPVERLVPNGDGSYLLDTWDGVMAGSWFSAPAFRRESHSGTAINAAGQTFGYAAVRLD